MSAVDKPPESDPDPAKLTGTALLQHVKRKLAAQRGSSLPSGQRMFRVVEVTRDPRGRLSVQGQVWHTDLDHVRRFGHALGANSAAQRVVIADQNGEVVEKIRVSSATAVTQGWEGWRDRALPPLPPRPKPLRPLRPSRPSRPSPSVKAPPPALADSAMTPVDASVAAPARLTREIPVVEQESFDPEATATLAPAPPP